MRMSNDILKFYLSSFLLSLMVFFPAGSAAQSTNFFSDEMCRLLNCFLNDSVILLISTVAITFLGIAAFFGKVNWGLVIVIGAGVIVIAGAREIAVLFVGGSSDDCGIQC